MQDAGYINEDSFLKWLEHFHKHRSPGKCLLNLDRHVSHCSRQFLNFCPKHRIDLLCLPPHKIIHVCQPLECVLFNPLKTCYHQRRLHLFTITQIHPFFTRFWKAFHISMERSCKLWQCYIRISLHRCFPQQFCCYFSV
jgi:hypothetical protein